MLVSPFQKEMFQLEEMKQNNVFNSLSDTETYIFIDK